MGCSVSREKHRAKNSRRERQGAGPRRPPPPTAPKCRKPSAASASGRGKTYAAPNEGTHDGASASLKPPSNSGRGSLNSSCMSARDMSSNGPSSCDSQYCARGASLAESQLELLEARAFYFGGCRGGHQGSVLSHARQSRPTAGHSRNTASNASLRRQSTALPGALATHLKSDGRSADASVASRTSRASDVVSADASWERSWRSHDSRETACPGRCATEDGADVDAGASATGHPLPGFVPLDPQ